MIGNPILAVNLPLPFFMLNSFVWLHEFIQYDDKNFFLNIHEFGPGKVADPGISINLSSAERVFLIFRQRSLP